MQKLGTNKVLMMVAMFLGVVIIALSVYLVLVNPKPATNNSDVTATKTPENQAKQIEFKITNQNSKVDTYTVDYKDGENGYELMKRLASLDSKFTFEYSESEYGVFVTGVNGYTPETSNAFWELMVNGKSSMVGVQDYEVKEGDKIEFKLTDIKPL